MPNNILEQISAFKQTDGYETACITACEDLWCIIKKILKKYNWFTVFGKIESIFSTVFLSRIIIIGGMRKYILFFGFQPLQINVAIVTVLPHCFAPKIVPERITKNCRLSKYFHKIQFTFVCCDLIWCSNTGLHVRYQHKYRYHEF